jgi:hypothetical protein
VSPVGLGHLIELIVRVGLEIRLRSHLSRISRPHAGHVKKVVAHGGDREGYQGVRPISLYPAELCLVGSGSVGDSLAVSNVSFFVPV